ncbi:MAG TPA: hypothetical protein VF765_31045 [Polyangiaceae bacterium]
MNVDWPFVSELGALAGVIFWGGKLVGRVEAAAKELEELAVVVKEVPKIDTRLKSVEEQLLHHTRNEHRDLRGELKEVSEAAIRAELASEHGGE